MVAAAFIQARSVAADFALIAEISATTAVIEVRFVVNTFTIARAHALFTSDFAIAFVAYLAFITGIVAFAAVFFVS